MFLIKNRSVIQIDGNDSKTFLQGLVTNDVFKVSKEKAVFALMLTPKGRILYDFFIIENKEGSLLVECNSELLDEILHRFSLYKLNHAIEVKKTEYKVICNPTIDVKILHHKEELDYISFLDPRNSRLGERILINYNQLGESGNKLNEISGQSLISLLGVECEDRGENISESYKKTRIELCIVDVDIDLVKETSFPMEYRMEHAISFNKGCYIGQEVTARFKLKGITSKRLYTIIIEEGILKTGDKIIKNDEIIGEILSISGEYSLAFCNVKLLGEGIALTGNSENTLTADNCKIRVLNY